MKRRSLLLAPLLATAPAFASTPPRLDALRARLLEAGRFYEDHVEYDQYVPYFNGVLAGFGGLADWAVSTINTGKVGHIVDVAVRFDENVEFVHLAIKFSSDYWERNNRLAELRSAQ